MEAMEAENSNKYQKLATEYSKVSTRRSGSAGNEPCGLYSASFLLSGGRVMRVGYQQRASC